MVTVKGPPNKIVSTHVLTAASSTADSTQVSCLGASRVHWSISATTTDQLATCSVQCVMTDGKVVTIVPAVFSAGVGLDSTVAELNAIGGAITADLSSATHRGILLRPMMAGTNGPYGIGGVLSGVERALLTMVKGAGTTATTYTVTAVVYYN